MAKDMQTQFYFCQKFESCQLLQHNYIYADITYRIFGNFSEAKFIRAVIFD